MNAELLGLLIDGFCVRRLSGLHWRSSFPLPHCRISTDWIVPHPRAAGHQQKRNGCSALRITEAGLQKAAEALTGGGQRRIPPPDQADRPQKAGILEGDHAQVGDLNEIRNEIHGDAQSLPHAAQLVAEADVAGLRDDVGTEAVRDAPLPEEVKDPEVAAPMMMGAFRS